MKSAIFNLRKSMGRLDISFHSIDPKSDLEETVLKGSSLFVQLDENINNLEQIFDCSDLALNDRIIFLDELDITNSFIGSVASMDRYGTVFSGERIFLEGQVKSDRVSKLYGKYFNIYKIS